MFYVYGLIDSSTGKCFYVGKGCNNRMYVHVAKVKRGHTTDNPHLDHTIAKLIRENIEITYQKFADNIVDEDVAYQLEAKQIIEIGIDNLCNVWHGGLGGRVPTDEVRQKISTNRRGIPVSTETRSKLSAAKLGTTASEQTKSKKSIALKGKSQTEAQRAANQSRSESLRGRVMTEEHKQKLREAKLKNPVKYWEGKTLSDEHKKKISKSVKETLKDTNEQSNE